MTVPRIVYTPGEPAGIGPDLVVALAQEPQSAELVAAADPALLKSRAAELGLPLTLRDWNPNQAPEPNRAGELLVAPVPLHSAARAGHLDPSNAQYVLHTLDLAIEGCLKGQFDALVTGPVHKGVINEAGIAFTGHTEYLAEKTATPRVVMMLATEGLRVALATTHLPLKDVAGALNAQLLTEVIEVLHGAMQRDFGLAQPKILVCGLNPHAGEGGHLGREEIDILEPVLTHGRARGFDLVGPLPADTLFTPRHLADADAVLAMYHDQGLPVLKYKGFGRAVNITLGLPLVRTSVDHGTALDLAGAGRADLGSLKTALDYAVTMAHARHHSPQE